MPENPTRFNKGLMYLAKSFVIALGFLKILCMMNIFTYLVTYVIFKIEFSVDVFFAVQLKDGLSSVNPENWKRHERKKGLSFF